MKQMSRLRQMKDFQSKKNKIFNYIYIFQ